MFLEQRKLLVNIKKNPCYILIKVYKCISNKIIGKQFDLVTSINYYRYMKNVSMRKMFCSSTSVYNIRLLFSLF